MWRIVLARLKQGHRTAAYPAQAPVLPDRFRGYPAVDSSRCPDGCRECVEACPTEAIRFDAQLMVFDLRQPDAPCYACLFPEEGEIEEVQCSVMGVFAPLTGVIGAMQAAEAIKLLAGVGESLSGRMLMFDAKAAEWRSVRVRKDPACKVCSTR